MKLRHQCTALTKRAIGCDGARRDGRVRSRTPCAATRRDSAHACRHCSWAEESDRPFGAGRAERLAVGAADQIDVFLAGFAGEGSEQAQRAFGYRTVGAVALLAAKRVGVETEEEVARCGVRDRKPRNVGPLAAGRPRSPRRRQFGHAIGSGLEHLRYRSTFGTDSATFEAIGRARSTSRISTAIVSFPSARVFARVRTRLVFAKRVRQANELDRPRQSGRHRRASSSLRFPQIAVQPIERIDPRGQVR